MGYETFTVNQNVTAVDIQTMGDMSIDDYKKYLATGLFSVDHHDILRSEPAGYPIAVTKEQFKALLNFLKSLESRVGAD